MSVANDEDPDQSLDSNMREQPYVLTESIQGTMWLAWRWLLPCGCQLTTRNQSQNGDLRVAHWHEELKTRDDLRSIASTAFA